MEGRREKEEVVMLIGEERERGLGADTENGGREREREREIGFVSRVPNVESWRQKKVRMEERKIKIDAEEEEEERESVVFATRCGRRAATYGGQPLDISDPPTSRTLFPTALPTSGPEIYSNSH